MTFTFFISTAAVSAITAAITGIVVALITRKTTLEAAREAASQEIKKLERTWEREDIVSSDEEFAEMSSAVAIYVYQATIPHSRDAIGKVASVRSKEHDNLGRILDALHQSITNGDTSRAERELTKAIDEKRRLKEGAANRSQTEIKAK